MSEPTAKTPREVCEQLLAGIGAGNWDQLADLYADDVVVEQPFGGLAPTRLEGRAAVHERFTTAARGQLELQARNVVIHQTTDPEVVVAEFDYDGRATDSGRTFTAANVQVLRVRDGRIVASRDYHDHAALAVAMGRVPELAAALTAAGDAGHQGESEGEG
jgi:ketosteroid isomerase-like protein